ncbi:MAG TPA: hypothetical protein ENO23_00135, partial [Alphaproteobacteria bacterium]|nr:hypothetical protein [Alphaproteobacteria bacterium]
MSDVYVIGIDMIKFGRFPEISVPKLGATAAHMALDDAGLEPDAVDHVNAHGTGTKLNDVAEARALGTIFGDRVQQIP